MPRVKTGLVNHQRHKKILKLAKGYWGKRSKSFRMANETVMKALHYARRHRREKKREFRSLWIARINAAARLNGLNYCTSSAAQEGRSRQYQQADPCGLGGYRMRRRLRTWCR
jgi:ribosomal protein L20